MDARLATGKGFLGGLNGGKTIANPEQELDVIDESAQLDFLMPPVSSSMADHLQLTFEL